MSFEATWDSKLNSSVNSKPILISVEEAPIENRVEHNNEVKSLEDSFDLSINSDHDSISTINLSETEIKANTFSHFSIQTISNNNSLTLKTNLEVQQEKKDFGKFTRPSW